MRFPLIEREPLPRSPIKPELRHVTIHVRADRLELMGTLLRVVRQSRNGWISGLIDEGLPRLAKQATKKRERIYGRKLSAPGT